jgi:hypothetical protein
VHHVEHYQADNSVSGLVPRGDVKQVGLIVIQQQLDDNPGLLTVILKIKQKLFKTTKFSVAVSVCTIFYVASRYFPFKFPSPPPRKLIQKSLASAVSM